MKKVLVTGGQGFIGGYVVEGLLRRGIAPVIFDRHLTRPLGDVDFYLGDVRNFTSVNEAVSLVDGVIHLAGVLGTAETVSEPRPSIDTNIYGTLNVLQACRNYGKKLTYISVGNYWMNNSYSITKDTAERFCRMFAKEHGVEVAVVRALNAYGPNQKIAPVRKIIPNFVVPALRNEEILIYGDGLQIMDMIYAGDVADILIRSLIKYGNYSGDTLEFPKFEAGTGTPTTVQEIAETVIDMVGSGTITNVPMRAGEPPNSIVLGDPNTLKPLYGGGLPKLIDLREGLVSTIEYYRWLLDYV